MTAVAAPPPRIQVVGVDETGMPLVELTLAHGGDPVTVLAAAGWRVVRAREVVRVEGHEHVLSCRLEVEPLPGGPEPAPGDVVLRRDPDLALDPGEVPEPHQRVAAYAVVTSERGLLLTEFSDRTGAPGSWGLPGGGLDPGEAPVDAVLREVWEESGQRVELTGLALVQGRRWVGRAPSGRLEDFHAVRIIYRATCREPTDPVVHDVGGTTASAAWVDPAADAGLWLTPGWHETLSQVLRHADGLSPVAGRSRPGRPAAAPPRRR